MGTGTNRYENRQIHTYPVDNLPHENLVTDITRGKKVEAGETKVTLRFQKSQN